MHNVFFQFLIIIIRKVAGYCNRAHTLSKKLRTKFLTLPEDYNQQFLIDTQTFFFYFLIYQNWS